MSIEQKLLKLMEAKKEQDDGDADDKMKQAAQDTADQDNDADDKKADSVDQAPAVTIENPIDPDLKNSESAQLDPDGDPDEQDQDEGIKEAFEDIKKGAFHKWLDKSEDEKITAADIKKGLASDDKHVNKMAQFAKNAKNFLHEDFLTEASFFIDGTEAAKDTIDHGDWTIHHLSKPGHSGASIVARHKDGKTPSINLYTGNRAGADHMFNHPTQLKNVLDAACGVMKESAIDIDSLILEHWTDYAMDRKLALDNKKVYPKTEYISTTTGKQIPVSKPAYVPDDAYLKSTGELEIGKNYSSLLDGNDTSLNSLMNFKVIGKRQDGKLNIRRITPSNQGLNVIPGDDHNFDIDDEFLSKTKTVPLKESAEIQDFVKEEELSEEFQLKVSTLFEAKVTEKVNTLVEEKTSQLEEEYRIKLDESIQTYETELTDKIDGYFGKLSEQWIKDNELALEASIRSELTESFMTGMKQLFESHYVDLPVEKFDIVTSLEEQLEASKAEIAAAKQLLEEQRAELHQTQRENILETATKGMTEIDAGKFRSLMEDFDFESSELYTKRAEIIKESFFGQNKKELSGKKLDISTHALVEEKQIDTKVAPVTSVSQYADFIRKTSNTKK